MASNRILDLLVPSAICVQLAAADSREVIATLSERLYGAGFVRETFANAALEREAQLPTGLPLDGQFNAAIPHTDVEHVIHSALALATLPEPIGFQNMIDPEEAVPVQLVILMAMDKPESQVEMLQEIAAVLQDADLINRLIAAEDADQIRQALSTIKSG